MRRRITGFIIFSGLALVSLLSPNKAANIFREMCATARHIDATNLYRAMMVLFGKQDPDNIIKDLKLEQGWRGD